MELKRAMAIYFIEQEIRQIQADLEELSAMAMSRNATDYMNAIEYSDMPKAKSYKNAAPFEEEIMRNTDKILGLKSRLEKKRAELLRMKEEFEQFMDTIDNPEIRLIMRWRCTEHERWEVIGERLHMDRRTASRIFYKQFPECRQVARNAHGKCDKV